MRYATVAVSVLIVIAVLIPGKDLPDVNIGGYDKLIHIVMFVAWAVAVRYDSGARPLNFTVVLLTGAAFSALTELLQLVVEGRSFDIYDMAADMAGLVVGLVVAGPLLAFINRRR